MPNFQGTAANDAITGTINPDVISGGAGDDTLNGLLGTDAVYGGDGHDTIFDWFGSDRIFGQNGDDIILLRAAQSRVQMVGLWRGQAMTAYPLKT